MWRSFLLLLLISVFTPAFGWADPILFYKSVAQGVDSAKGRVILNTRDGLWSVPIKVPGITSSRVMFIRTSVDQRMILDFDYEGGSIAQGTVQFRPPIHVEVSGPGSAVSASISSISYDDTGDPSIDVADDDNSHFSNTPAAMAVLYRAFILDNRPVGALLGVPFPNIQNLNSCSSDQQPSCSVTTGPFVTEVRLLPHDGTPALDIILKDGAQISFDANNILKFIGPASLVLSSVDYSVDGGSLTGEIDSLNGSLQYPSRLVTSGFDLSLDSTSSFNLQTISFTSAPGTPSSISAENGSISASVGDSSKLSLSNKNEFFLDDGTSINLINSDFIFGGNQAPEIKVGSGSSINVNLRDGEFSFGSAGHLDVLSGQFQAHLVGDWSPSQPDPSTTASLQNISVKVSSGQISPNSRTTFVVGGGSDFSSTELDISPVTKSLQGKLSSFDLNLDNGSTLGIPGGFVMSLTAGAEINMDPNDPLIFNQQGLSSGTLLATGQFDAFLDKPTPDFGLSDGHVSAVITKKPDQSQSGVIRVLDGTFNLTSGNSTLSWYMNLHDINFQTSALGTTFTASGRFSGKFLSGNSLKVTVPGDYSVPYHDDMAQYPLNFGIRWLQDTDIPDSPIEISDRLHINNDSPLEFQTAFKLDVPSGLGEHESRKDPNSADGTHGPDNMQHLQEVMQDSEFACTVHIYLDAASYDGITDVSLQSLTGNAGHGILAVTVNDTTMAQHVGYERDGCNLGVMGTILGATLGLVTGAGVVNGVIVGGIVGPIANNDVDQLIDGRLQEEISAFQKTWSINLPTL